jgi:uncharacterized protein (DUF924 family)
MPSIETSETIREFWFGTNPDDTGVAKEKSKLWWSKDPATDQQIRQRFEPFVLKAVARALDGWLAAPAGRLALILLTDQFPRSMYRNTPKAFAFDPLARAWCREAIADSSHRLLRPIERVFLYLPLQHSESLEDQQQSVFLNEELAIGVDTKHRATFDEFLAFAVRHRDIVARFGRFPHRNRILGRQSSPEELRFLEEKGSSF